MLADWEDPSLQIAGNKKVPDFTEHFWPKFEIQGFMDDSMGARSPDFDAKKWHPKYKPDHNPDKNQQEICITGHHASLSLKWTGEIFTRIDDGTFPFDSHALEISVKVLPVFLSLSHVCRSKLCHPRRWLNQYHELLINGDIIDGFTICRLAAKAYSSRYGPFIDQKETNACKKDQHAGRLYQDTYTVQM